MPSWRWYVHLPASGLAHARPQLDLRAEVVPGPEDKKERYEIARRTFAQLEQCVGEFGVVLTRCSIPVECVASNSESLRGKVLRVVVSLLSAEAEQTPRSLWDWWGMYSRVEFVQLLPAGS